MAMGEAQGTAQGEFWVETRALARAPGHPFYQRLNVLLKQHGFDEYVAGQCAEFYAEDGRPGIPPGVYFRMLMIGYFEGLDSERGIAWRCADSLSLRTFLGYGLDQETPEHSSLSRIRHRIDVETHAAVFVWVLKVLAQEGLVSGTTVGVDGTTLEANAALRSIVRRDTGEKYQEFLERLAKASGIETPTREDLAKLDRKRAKKGSNDEWKHPYDPDARITKMKDGRTHLAHKAEHAVDMESGAVLAVTLQHANLGDTTTIAPTLEAAKENLEQVAADSQTADAVGPGGVQEVVADKGYHSNASVREFSAAKLRTYIAEPERGRRRWECREPEQKAVYANRRRIRGVRGRRLMRRRGELIERTFAHCYETGAMRRTYLRGQENILKRLLVHVAGFDLGLVMRKLLGHGTPRELANGLGKALLALFASVVAAIAHLARITSADDSCQSPTGADAGRLAAAA